MNTDADFEFVAEDGLAMGRSHLSGAPWPASASAWTVAACSAERNQVVTVLPSGGIVTSMRAFPALGGDTTYEYDDPAPQPGPGCSSCHAVMPLVASHDGTNAIENLADGTSRNISFLTGYKSRPTEATGVAIGRSWNGHRSARSDGVIDAATGQLVWKASASLSASFSRPNSDDLLVMLSSAKVPAALIIVHADRTVITLAATERWASVVILSA